MKNPDLQCQDCKYKFKSTKTLRDYIATHEKSKDIYTTCPMCNQKIRLIHTKENKKIYCPKCNGSNIGWIA